MPTLMHVPTYLMDPVSPPPNDIHETHISFSTCFMQLKICHSNCATLIHSINFNSAAAN